MIIKFIAENEKDIQRLGGRPEKEHVDVQEFFMFGTMIDEGNNVLDFHDWNGGYRFLIGGLAYFNVLIGDERREKSDLSVTPSKINVPAVAKKALNIMNFDGMVKRAVLEEPEIEILEQPKVEDLEDLEEPPIAGFDLN